MTIWFGANDSCLAPSPQHVRLPRVACRIAPDPPLTRVYASHAYQLPITKFQANLRTMIAHVRAYSPKTKLLLLTPPPIHGPTRAALMAPQPLDRAQATTQAYAKAVLEVGQTEGVAVLDVFGAVERALGGELEQAAHLFRDGLHLNRDGYQVRLSPLLDRLLAAH
jgi:lysophospholipase L1-like esterase